MCPGTEPDSSSRLPGGWLLQTLPFAILGAAALRIRLLWNQIPKRFAIHWNLHGTPDRWATKSFIGVYGVLLMGLAGCAILLAISSGMGAGFKKLRAAETGVSSAALNQPSMRWTFIEVEFFVALMLGWAAMLPLRANPQASPDIRWVVFLTLLFVVLVILQMSRIQRRRKNLKNASMPNPSSPAASPQTRLEIDRQNPRYWKAGMFYVNRQDPSIFVAKLSGLGYTLNFGHPASWLLLAILLFLPLAIALCVSH